MLHECPIAVVGMGGVFPGAADLPTYWQNIIAKLDMTRDVPPGRWVLDPRMALGDGPLPDKVYSIRGCFVEDFAFDPAGLQIDRELTRQLDPLYHMTLHAGRAAFRDARMDGVDCDRIGVFLAAIALPTDASSAITRELIAPEIERQLAGQSRSVVAARAELPVDRPRTHPLNSRVVGLPAALLAQSLGLGGGSYTLDAACASSLYALKLACDELRAGRADAMLAGGVSRPECLYTQMGFSQLRALSPSGRCSPFDASCDGLIVGEGAGVVALKRLDDAIRDGDRVYSVIRGIGLSNDIGGSLLAPDSEGQLRAMRQAYAQAGWSPGVVDLIECHGTGTPTGDAVEVRSLRSLWNGLDGSAGRCPIGSIKSMIGHLLTGAGAAGLIKVLLAMRQGILPPSANYQHHGEAIPLGGSPFRVQTQPQPWERRQADTPRRAAVSAFGFGGINAHVLLEEWHTVSRAGTAHIAPSAEVAASRQADVEAARAGERPKPLRDARESIAIVGMAAQFAGAESLELLRQLIVTGIPPAPSNRDSQRTEDVQATDPTQSTQTSGLYLAGIDMPVGRFRVPPNELPEILPQQLLALEVAADAMEDAGLPLRETRPDAAVLIGMGLDFNTTNFHLRWWLPSQARRLASLLGVELSRDEEAAWIERMREALSPALNATRTLGALGGMIASRIARELQFGGPSFAVSCDEASGLRALEIAVRALQARDINTAVVGAVDLASDPRHIESSQLLRSLGRGSAPAFDLRSDGWSVGEGATAIVLKRLSDAEKAGDTIHAVIRGVGAASGEWLGTGSDAAAIAYERALRRACVDGDVDVTSIGLIEAHGSGVSDEDRAELTALERVLGQNTCPAALGSLKSILGHTGAAAGLASLVKAAMCIRHAMLPPLPEFRSPIAPAAGLHVPIERQYWWQDRASGPRRAGIGCLTPDGNTMFVVLEEAPNASSQTDASRNGALPVGLFPVEANDVPGLLVELSRLDAFVRQRQEPMDASASHWTAMVKTGERRALAVAIFAASHSELLARTAIATCALRNAPTERLDGRDGVYFEPQPIADKGLLAFVYPGSGSHFLGMGRDLAACFPEIARKLESEGATQASQFCPTKLMPHRIDWSEGWREAAEQLIADEVESLIFGQVSFGVLMSDILRSLGVRPGAVIGYSLGESAGLFATRAWPDRDEMYRRMHVSPLFKTALAGPRTALRAAWSLTAEAAMDWCAAVVSRGAEEVRAAIADEPHARLLIVNTPRECVVGGMREAVHRVARQLGCRPIPIGGVPTVHCEAARTVEQAYRELHLMRTIASDGIRFYSAAAAKAYELTRETAAESITAQALHGFDFCKLIRRAHDDGVRLFVEIGPQASCTRMIHRILDGQDYFAASASGRVESEILNLLELLAALIVHRVPVDLSSLFPTRQIADEAHPERKAEAAHARSIHVPINSVIPRSIPLPKASPRSRQTVEQDVVRDAQRNSPTRREPARMVTSSRVDDAGLRGDLVKTAAAVATAHDAYLHFSRAAMEGMSSAMAWQAELLASVGTKSEMHRVISELTHIHDDDFPASPADKLHQAEPPAFDRELCLEFAQGSVGRVLGPEFAVVDSFPTRVRLPDEPLMLVDRIVTVEGRKGGLTGGRVVTEHDVMPGAWYLDGGKAPICITVEAGQADLFLSGYLGIDFATKGLRTYRLLDATVTLHRGLPRPGEVIRYDIRIDRFVRQGETYLFFFEFDGTINGEPVLTMRKGCAGFFTQEETKASHGLVLRADEQTPAQGRVTGGYASLDDAMWSRDQSQAADHSSEAYSDTQLAALRRGDLAGCFGARFDGLELRDPLRLPGGRMKLIDRVLSLDLAGGRFGLGRIVAEADIHPDDWFLTCHFLDDMVMPGTLMYECCVHALRFFLLRAGWVGEQAGVCYEPVQGVSSSLRCRGPVTPKTKKASYQVDIKEVGYRDGEPDEHGRPTQVPYVLADALMFADGAAIVQMNNMSLQPTGLTRDMLEKMWAGHRTVTGAAAQSKPATVHRKPAFSYEQILAFAIGKPSDCFGPRYAIFDGDERRVARLPGPPYQFLDRVTTVEPPPFELKPGGWVEAEYDVPCDAWYFAANRQPTMPFAVLLEVALQPCGFLAAYAGSALTGEADLSFRNLGGDAILHDEVHPHSGTLRTRVRMTNVSRAGGMIIQGFDMQVRCGDRMIYEGTTSFGFFSAEALAKQVGIRDARERLFVPTPDDLASARRFSIPTLPPHQPSDSGRCIPDHVSPSMIHWPVPADASLPGRAFRMIEQVDMLLPDGGPHGLGFVQGSTPVDPSAWFFKAHFFQDPVWPGSLGLESFLQLLKAYMLDRWPLRTETHRFEAFAVGLPHQWAYRGQIIPRNSRVEVQAVIKRREDGETPIVVADGFLGVDGIIIYEMKNFGIRMVPQ